MTMPSREEMIGYLSQQNKPSRDEMINFLSQPTKDNVINEMHPAVSWKDRAVVKNLSSNPETSLMYLKEKYPNLETKYEDGKFLMKGKTEKDWRVLDPEGFDLQDITDIAGDVAQGSVEALAGLGGGAVGNLPGAMVASGGAGAATEAVKQKLGELAGLKNNVNTEDVLVNAGLSGISPLLFGSGNAAKDLIKKGISERAANLTERGLVGSAWHGVTRKVAPATASFLSSGGKIPAESYVMATKHPEKLAQIAEAPLDTLTSKVAELKDLMTKRRDELGTEVSKLADESGVQVDVLNTRKKLLDRRFELADLKDRQPTPANEVMYNEFNNLINKYFGDAPTIMSVEDATNLKRQLQTAVGTIKGSQDPTLKDATRILIDTYKDIGKEIDSALTKSGIKGLPEANANYAQYKQLENLLEKQFGKTGQNPYVGAMKFLRQMNKKKEEIPLVKDLLNKTDKELGTSLSELSTLIPAASKLANPSRVAQQYGSVLGGVAIPSGAGYLVGKEIDDKYGGQAGRLGGISLFLGMSSPAMWKRMLSAGYKAEKRVFPKGVKKQMTAQSLWDLMSNRSED